MQNQIQNKAEIFKALGDPTRLKILQLIADAGNNLCVGMIANKTNVSQPAVSQHLKVLKNAGLVIADKKGFHVHYSIKSDSLDEFGIDTLKFLTSIDAKIDESKTCECADNSSECETLNQ